MRVAAGAGPDLGGQPPEMPLLDLPEPARTILGRVAPPVRDGAAPRASCSSCRFLIALRRDLGDMRVAAGAGPDLVEQPPEMRLLDLLEPARTILGRVAPWVRSGADQRAILLPLICREGLHCDDLIDDAGQLAADLGALDLRHPVLAAVIILALIKDADEDDVPIAGVLQVAEPCEHLTPVQPIGAARVRLAGFLGECIGLA